MYTRKIGESSMELLVCRVFMWFSWKGGLNVCRRWECKVMTRGRFLSASRVLDSQVVKEASIINQTAPNELGHMGSGKVAPAASNLNCIGEIVPCSHEGRCREMESA